MPRVDFAPENKVATVNYDFPKLKLKLGELARIMAGLESPVMEYVHTLRKPEIINGVPTMVTEKRKNGSEYLTNKMIFVSSSLCLGDATILGEQGSDPKHCPVCKLAKERPDVAQPPRRRYAMHVIRYRTKSGTTNLANPFNVELLVWSFSDTIFNKLVDFKTEWEDLRRHDLLLGPCKSENFQQFDITVAQKAEWIETPDRKKVVIETFKENQVPDLTIALGSPKKVEWLEQDINTVLEAWAEVNGAVAATTSVSLDDDLNNLLDSPSAFDTEESAKDDSTDDLPDMEDLLATTVITDEESDVDIDFSTGEITDPAPAAKKAAPAAKKAAPEVAVSDLPSVDNFEDLLAEL